MCRRQAIPATKNIIVAAVKNVSSALQIASKKGGLSSPNTVKNPDRGGRSLAVLKEYQDKRNEDKILIASINSEARNDVDVPLLEVSSIDLSEKSFCVELARILLEPKCCIYFETRNLTQIGLDRISSLLKRFVELWDSRVLILLEFQEKLPEIISRYVEKSFMINSLEVSTEPLTKKIKLSERASNEFLNECLLKRDGEIYRLKEELKCSAENMKKFKVEIKKLQEENVIQEEFAKKSDIELKDLKESLEFEKIVNEDKKILECRLASALGEKEKVEILLTKEMEEQAKLKNSLKDVEIDNLENITEIVRLVEENKVLNEKLKKSNEQLDKASIDIDKSEVTNEEETGTNEEGNGDEGMEEKSRIMLQKIKSSILKFSSNSKLSRKTVVFRCIKHLKIDESYVVGEDTTLCELKVKNAPHNVLTNKYFNGTAMSKTKSQDNAYLSLIDFLKS